MRTPSIKTAIALALTALFFPRGTGHAQETLSYKVRETDRSVELSTPFGARQVIGDVGSTTNRYHIEIPIESLKPTPAPTTSPNERQPNSSSREDREADELVREITKEKSTTKKTAMGGDGTDKGDDDDDEPNELGERPVKPRSRKRLPSPIDPGYEYDDSDRLVLEANHLYNLGKFYEASLYVEELIRKKPTYLRGWIMKGSLMWVQGEKELAKNAWRQALAIEPDSQEVKDLLQRYR